LVANIDVLHNGNTVTIRGKNASQGGGMTIISGGGSHISVGRINSRSIVVGGNVSYVGRDFVGGQNIVVGGGGNISEVGIDIKVPNGTDIDVSDIDADVTIGNTKGNLRASIGGSGSVSAGSVKKINGRISGSGRITIASVTGDAKLSISGSGSVQIDGGEIQELEVSVSGSGNAQINATAKEGDLDVSGVGRINVNHITKNPRRRVSGVGSINVGNW
jgi:hypothetical protein